MEALPFLFFIIFCLTIVGMVCGLFYLLVRLGRGESDGFRSLCCPECNTRRKPRKTGHVRNLVEIEQSCPECGYISWDIPPKTNLSTPPSSDPTSRQSFSDPTGKSGIRG